MTGHQINSLVGDLVAMAQAMERLPIVESDLAEARNTINSHLTTIQRLEAKLMDRAAECEAYLATIRSLEVERDDAQFHALEADDRTQRALDFIKATFGNAGTLIQALEPPAKSTTPDVSVSAVPEAAAEGEPVSPNVGTSTASPSSDVGQPELNHPDGLNHGAAPAPEVAPMQASPTAMTESATSENASFDTAASMANASSGSTSDGISPVPSSAPPIDRGLYHGMTYSEAKNKLGSAFTRPSKNEWLDNGGSLDNWYV